MHLKCLFAVYEFDLSVTWRHSKTHLLCLGLSGKNRDSFIFAIILNVCVYLYGEDKYFLFSAVLFKKKLDTILKICKHISLIVRCSLLTS